MIEHTPESEATFWSRVEKTPGCWIWQGDMKDEQGVPAFWFKRRQCAAHRFSWEIVHGLLPRGRAVVVSRTCGTDECVNPAHMRSETWAEFNRRHRRPWLERFWENVPKSEGCWEWAGGRDAKGYGVIFDSRVGQYRKAHRVSWEIHRGPIPRGLHVCHSCDNRPCVNPDHLWLGTHNDNMRDMVEKGRNAVHLGDAHPNSKLTAAKVREIRRAYAKGGVTQLDLARRYGVKKSTIGGVLSRRNWAHVQP